MDCKSVGGIIAQLRRRSGITQAELARKLNVSDKAVSRWESGQGYPEITQFPALANLFGVSIDYLMTGQRRGVAIAGNILADLVKTVEKYPLRGTLTNILSVRRSVGGCVPNVATYLAKIDRRLPLSAYGCVGDDDNGHFVISQLRNYGVQTEGIRIIAQESTGFSDIMSIPKQDQTFFHASGANARFAPEYADPGDLKCSILHFGYPSMLERFSQADDEYGTVLARFLREVRLRGIKVSVDMLGDVDAAYRDQLISLMPWCDYAILSEAECCAISGLSARLPDGRLRRENIFPAMKHLIQSGVREKVIVCSREAGFCLDTDTGAFTSVPALRIPPERIRGYVGDRDAFSAGCLYGIYNEYSDEKLLQFAASAVACSLTSDNSVDGMRSREELIKIWEEYPKEDAL